MLESSRDILNLTIAFCILWITVFLCWIMYYAIASMKKINDALNLFNIVMTSINTFINRTKEKIHDSVSNFQLVGMLVKKILEEVEKRKNNRATKKSKKSSEK